MNKSFLVIWLMLLLCHAIGPVCAQPGRFNIYEISNGETLANDYHYIEYLYDDLLAAVPVVPGVDDYAWKNLTGVIDFQEKVIVPFRYRNIRRLRNHVLDDERIRRSVVAVSDGQLPMLYRLSKENFVQVSPNRAAEYRYLPDNDSIIFTTSDFGTNYIIDLNTPRITPTDLRLRSDINDHLLDFKANRKHGLADLGGNIVVPPEFYRFLPEKHGLIVMEKGEKGDSIGILDSRGETLLPPVFQQITVAENRLFVRAFNDGKKLKLPPEVIEKLSDWTAIFTNGRTRKRIYSLNKSQIAQTGLVGAFDLEGNLVIPFEYDNLEKGISTEIIASRKGQSGIISDRGEIVKDFNYQTVQAAFNRFYTVKQNGRKGLLGSGGKEIFEPEYEDIFPLSPDRVLLKQGRWMLWDTARPDTLRQTILAPDATLDYLYTHPHNEKARTQYFRIEQNGRYGIVDQDLKTIVPPTHADPPTLVYGKRFAFGYGRSSASYTLKGIPMQGLDGIDYNEESDIYTDIIVCKKNEKYGAIDQDGREVIPFKYDMITNIDGKRFIVGRYKVPSP